MKRASLLAWVLLSVGCSGASGGGGGPGIGGSGATGGVNLGGSGGAVGGAGGGGGVVVTGGNGGGTQTGCSAESQFVYVIDSAETLFKFDPPSLAFTPVGTVNCGAGFLDTPFSMAVDRNANAWVVYTDGSLYKVDTKTAACTPTGFTPGQSGFVTFGMGFSTEGAGSTKDTLFVSQADALGTSTGLAIIDTQSLVLTPIGAYDQTNSRAELTGTGDGKLFGAFEGSPYVVSQIDKSNAKILSQAPQSPIQYPPGASNFAFAFWGGSFWLFVGPGTSTDVFHYDPSLGTTTKVTSVPQVIVGAGVSTCAPIKPPK
ncbi:MAG: hypothetical protein IPI67_08325 [Myxococcales bacterium]|nr:hypothetical protein [Myxococcales bacterium]